VLLLSTKYPCSGRLQTYDGVGLPLAVTGSSNGCANAAHMRRRMNSQRRVGGVTLRRPRPRQLPASHREPGSGLGVTDPRAYTTFGSGRGRRRAAAR
jgi:hypothetical protein